MVRRCFYSFHYQLDNWRVSTVRNIGMIEGNRPASDNDWETVTRAGDIAIQNWIQNQLKGRSCTIVLVGTNTANRKWINYEISESWNRGMGVVGLRIHGLLDRNQNVSAIGHNPFDFISFTNSGTPLSSVVKCYNPPGVNSRDRYAWISQHLENAVSEAISIRKRS